MRTKEKEDYVSIGHYDEFCVYDAFFETYPTEAFTGEVKIKDFERFTKNLAKQVIMLHINPDGNITFTHMTLCKIVLENWCLKKLHTIKEKFEFADSFIAERIISGLSLDLHNKTKHLFYDLFGSYRLHKRKLLEYKLNEAADDIINKIILMLDDDDKGQLLDEINRFSKHKNEK